jgi:dTMP kinase
MDLGWCKAPDTGLPAPDATLYLTLDRGAAAARAGYGQERYEKQEFQDKVRQDPGAIWPGALHNMGRVAVCQLECMQRDVVVWGSERRHA